MLLFLVFYIIAAFHYPGGSYVNRAQTGFSFKYNYLCDLLDDVAINGEINSARIFARIALGILCISLILLWSYLPRLFDVKRKIHVLISSSGILSMLITVFLAFGSHDIVVRIAGLFGAIALLLTFRQLYKAHYGKHLFLGILSLVLFLANYYVYETGVLIERLPLLQKFTFMSCMTWFVILNILLIRKLRHLKI
jgi:hypothetical protein